MEYKTSIMQPYIFFLDIQWPLKLCFYSFNHRIHKFPSNILQKCSVEQKLQPTYQYDGLPG